MNIGTKWVMFTLMVVLLAVFSVHATERSPRIYFLTVTTDTYASGLTYDDTGTTLAIGWGLSEASTDGSVICSADTYTEAEGDSVSLEKEASATVTYTWEWIAPPGYDPPGGDLYWENDGDGFVSIDGYNSDNGGSTAASSMAWNKTSAEPPVSSTVYMAGKADASVSNHELPNVVALGTMVPRRLRTQSQRTRTR